jgi:hypothetical protein
MDGRTGRFQTFYKRSTDGGATWGADTMLSNSSSTAAYPSVAASGSNVHVAWEDDRDGGNAEYYTKRSTDGGTTWGPDTRLTYNSNQVMVTIGPSVAASGSNVHIVRNSGPGTSANDVYYLRSTNGGTTWGPDTRLTHTDTTANNPSVAVAGRKVHVVWWDWRNGTWAGEIYYKRDPTGNPSGVEEVSQNANFKFQNAKLTITPNPFISFTTVPGHERESFALYDVSGRKAGTYPGSRIGEGLRAGVYFLKAEGQDAMPVRVVKLR